MENTYPAPIHVRSVEVEENRMRLARCELLFDKIVEDKKRLRVTEKVILLPVSEAH